MAGLGRQGTNKITTHLCAPGAAARLNLLACTQAAWSKLAATSGRALPAKALPLRVRCMLSVRDAALQQHPDCPCLHIALCKRMQRIVYVSPADTAQAMMRRRWHTRLCAPSWAQPRLPQPEDPPPQGPQAVAQLQPRPPRLQAAQLRCVPSLQKVPRCNLQHNVGEYTHHTTSAGEGHARSFRLNATSRSPGPEAGVYGCA